MTTITINLNPVNNLVPKKVFHRKRQINTDDVTHVPVYWSWQSMWQFLPMGLSIQWLALRDWLTCRDKKKKLRFGWISTIIMSENLITKQYDTYEIPGCYAKLAGRCLICILTVTDMALLGHTCKLIHNNEWESKLAKWVPANKNKLALIRPYNLKPVAAM